VAKGVTFKCDPSQADNVQDAMRIINSDKYPLEKISNIHYALED